jgi:hypothetical protein
MMVKKVYQDSSFVSTTYIGAEVLEGVCLHGVDAQSRVRLNDSEATRD